MTFFITKYLKIYVLLFLYCGLSHITIAQPIEISDSQSIMEIGKGISYLEDKNNQLNIYDLLDTANIYPFQQLEGNHLNFGVTASTIWLKFNLTNHLKSDLGLFTGRNFLDTVRLYSVYADGSFAMKRYGTSVKMENRDVHVHNHIFRLDSAVQYFLEVKTMDGPVLINPKVGSIERMMEQAYEEVKYWGLYVGFILLLSIYSIMLFVSSRPRNYNYLYYIGFMVSTSLLASFMMGTMGLFLPEVIVEWSSGYSLLILFFVFFFGANLMDSFIHVKEKRHLIVFTFKVMQYVPLVMFGLNLLGQSNLVFTVFVYIIGAFFMLHIVLLALLMFGEGAVVRIMIIGMALMMISGVVFICKEVGFIEENFFTQRVLVIGHAIEAILLAVAMALQSESYKREKTVAQKLALVQARGFSKNLIYTQENERKRVAAELHDGVGQHLILIKNQLYLLKRQTGMNIDNLFEGITQVIEDIRRVSYALRPHKLDLFGLTASLEDLLMEVEESSSIEIKVSLDNIDDIFNSEDQINIYRVVQESVNNMVKHAQCTEAEVIIRVEKESVDLSIKDNGVGFIQQNDMTPKNKSGFGLKGLNERVNNLGGQLNIDSKKGFGTIVSVTVPILQDESREITAIGKIDTLKKSAY